jgi:hypothetical protein
MDRIRRFNALLVEGIPGIGKSTLIDALIRRHMDLVVPGKVRTFVHLCQAHTIGPLAQAEDRGTPAAHQNHVHLDRIVSMLEWLHDAVRQDRQPSCFVMVDTLHLTHCLRPGALRWTDAAPFDRRLANIGVRLLLLRAQAPVVWERCIQDRAGWWLNTPYAARFGSTLEECHAYFLGEQERFNEMAGQSALDTLTLENDGDVDEVLDRAHDFWYSTYALRCFQRPLSTVSRDELRRLRQLLDEPADEAAGTSRF